MSIAIPYRPKKDNIVQVQPHLVQASVGSVLVEPVDTTVTAGAELRTTIFEREFAPTYETDYDWDFVNTGFSAAVMSATHGTLNGSQSVKVTWASGASHRARFGGRLTMASAYSSGWFTFDIKIHSPFSNPKGLKLPGFRSWNQPGSSAPYSCASGFYIQTMLSDNGSNTTEPREAHQYIYEHTDTGVKNEWDNGNTVIEMDKVARIEMYFKLNSSANANDGILRTKYDVGTTTTHATPTTTRASYALQMYCNNEAFRTSAMMGQIVFTSLFGGATSTWEPEVPSAVEFGRWALEVKA